jgi:hypothetical protein
MLFRVLLNKKRNIFCAKKRTSEIAAQINAQNSCVLYASVVLFRKRIQRRHTLRLMSGGIYLGALADSATRLRNFVNLIDQLGPT